MEIFRLTVDVMLMMFLLVAVGVVLRKKEILPEGSDRILAKLETYALVPAMNFYNWSTNCTVSTLKANASLILYGLVLISVAVGISYPMSKLFVRRYAESAELSYQRNIYKYAIAFGNYGFLGNFVVLGIFGNEGLFKYSMFTLGFSFLVNSWGIYTLVPGGQKPTVKEVLKKLFTPPIISLFLGCVVGLCGFKVYIPDFALRALNNMMNCMGPLAMILAGVVMGGYGFRNLIKNKKVYIVSFLRLILIPTLILSIATWAGVEDFTKTLMLIAFGAPLGLNTIVYPATYGGDTHTGAAMTFISTTLSLVTIPLLYYIFIVIL